MQRLLCVGNPELLEKVQAISKDSKDEGLKKAADGLVWKLIRGRKEVQNWPNSSCVFAF